MRRLRRLIELALAVAAIAGLWLAGLPVLAGLVALICGLAAVHYLLAGANAGDGRSALEREGHERFQRNIPPPS